MALREQNIGPAPDVEDVSLDPKQKEVALGVTFQLDIGEKRHIVMQTYIGRDCEIGALNGMLDKIGKAMDRQNAKYRVYELQVQRDLQVKRLAEMMENHSQTMVKWEDEWVKSKRRGPFDMTPSQHQQKIAMDNTFKGEKYRLEVQEAEIAELKLQVKG